MAITFTITGTITKYYSMFSIIVKCDDDTKYHDS